MIKFQNPKRFELVLKSVRFPLVILIALMTLSSSVFPVYAKTLEEIEKEIIEKQKELETLEQALEDAQNQIEYSEYKMKSASNDLDEIKAELNQVKLRIKKNKAEKEKFEQMLELKNLELEKGEKRIGEELVNLYVYEKDGGIIDMMIQNGEMTNFWKDYKYREALFDIDFNKVLALAGEVEELGREREEYEGKLVSLEEENEKLAASKKDLENQVNNYNSTIAYNKNLQSGIRAQMGVVQQEVEGLSAEQRAMIAKETELIKDADGGSKPLEQGKYYLYGRGRAIYQGHGLGFSQYGAFGGAQKGMSATDIAKFYYKGSAIGTASGNISVSGYGTMNIEDYVAGIGEVPDKACGNQSQANSRPDKYVLDNPNTIWDCWPEESIKAQVIVARSFGLAYGGTICTTATCQVYKGGNGKAWAAKETAGKVLKVGGSVIKAYYSSDNNNGWGTGTHRNPTWCSDFAGNCGAGYSWLQSVKDSTFAAKGPYTDWKWRTNSYTISDIESMFRWYSKRGYTYPKSSDVANMLNAVGTIRNLRMKRDASGRVARVEVVGTKGTRTVNGEFFKMMWNFWIGNVKPSGEFDYIFSLTYYFVSA